MKKIAKVFIANRGEIAVRIIKACQELGIQSVLGVSEADKCSFAAEMADQVVCIGPPQAQQSYLRVDTIVTAALGTGADAVHPGYGFLAEKPELPELCAEKGLVFIGPDPETIRKMGDKLTSREIVGSIDVPIIPGSEAVRDFEAAQRVAEEIGFPVLIKAAAGGGGKGIKVVNRSAELKTLFEEASAEARSAFGDETLYIERLIANPRHIEVQILSDSYGNTVHLFERDCSLQRRYQKMIEEAPSPVVSPEMREQICRAAVKIADHVKYENAGTVEMVLDQDQDRFYFLEMNTRIQVEHPITEMITGVDLVKEQIRIANREPLGICQESLAIQGHAIECRINAEDPYAHFRPCPGRIHDWDPPKGDKVRVDSHCHAGYFVSPYYDNLIAKLIVKGKDRLEAIAHMDAALTRFVVKGVETTIPLYQYIMEHQDFLNGNTNTKWVENILLGEFQQKRVL